MKRSRNKRHYTLKNSNSRRSRGLAQSRKRIVREGTFLSKRKKLVSSELKKKRRLGASKKKLTISARLLKISREVAMKRTES